MEPSIGATLIVRITYKSDTIITILRGGKKGQRLSNTLKADFQGEKAVAIFSLIKYKQIISDLKF